MLDKLFGKKQKGIEVFNIPQKKYCHEKKKLDKMDKKDLADVINDMEKYITNLCQKLQLGKKEFERSQQRYQQTIQKSNVMNSQISKITNEHEQLQVKFTNLQSSLQMMIIEREGLIKSQSKYIQENGLSRQKIKDLNKVIEIYQNCSTMTEKLSHQNKQLKQKYQSLQTEYHVLSQKFNQAKMKSSAVVEKSQSESKQTHEDQFLQKQNANERINSNENGCDSCKRLQSMIQGKQQIIASLNKQTQGSKDKLRQINDKIQQLNNQLENMLKQVQQKDQQISKIKVQRIQLNNQLGLLKNSENKIKISQKNLKQECQVHKKNSKQLEQSLENIKNKLIKIQQQKISAIQQKQKLKNNFEQQKKKAQKQLDKIKYQLEHKQIQLSNINQKLHSYEKQIVQLTKLSSQLKNKDNQIANLKNQLSQDRNKIQQSKKSAISLQQQYQIKLKKSQFACNQERIKAQALKRNLTNLEVQQEQNKKNLDSMYETKMQQQGKIVQMEKKLKQYKHLIQYLKKQKIQLELTFEKKIKNMEEIVVHEEEETNARSPLQSPPGLAASPRFTGEDDFEKQTIIQQNKIANLEQQIDMLRQQNMNLKLDKEQLQQANEQIKRNLKNLSDRREQAIRQIKKLSSIKGIEPSDKTNKQSSQNADKKSKQKDKKVAQKAYKGFDILAKQLSNLYKQFIKVHMGQIQKKQVKDIQNTINLIVRKSLDMKDIFQDYI